MFQHKNRNKMTPTNKVQSCRSPFCIFCMMQDPEPSFRRDKISSLLEAMPRTHNEEIVVVVSALWNIAMSCPNDPELPNLGIFDCMVKLIQKGLKDTEWLHRGRNMLIPYYSAHIIGSYIGHSPELAHIAIRSGVIPPLLELLRGDLTWVEQRVAIRALGHIAGYESTFQALVEYQEEVVRLAIRISTTCIEDVHKELTGVRERGREKYYIDLLTRGVGGVERENRTAEQWASQLQCWSLYILNCFAYRGISLDLICKTGFLRNLPNMWGGLVNDSCPAGYGLLRTLCCTKYGRERVAEVREVLESLGNLSRSSDDWQYIGIDCLVLLLKDLDTKYLVVDTAIDYLTDLVELKSLNGRRDVGQAVINVLLSNTKERNYSLSDEVRVCIEEVKGMVERREKEKTMSAEMAEQMRAIVSLTKLQGIQRFQSRQIEQAIDKYSEGLELCPLKLKKERIVLFSNRAQCFLLLGDADAAIRDTTRALCLTTPPNTHGKSLWRRSQAYDLKGMAKESLMDCLMFLNCCCTERNYLKIPYYVARMIRKHVDSMSLFNGPRLGMHEPWGKLLGPC